MSANRLYPAPRHRMTRKVEKDRLTDEKSPGGEMVIKDLIVPMTPSFRVLRQRLVERLTAEEG